ncbi:hypothetical protein [Nonlabens sp. Asnod3-H03]|nr:hypothetical protein [Nonlabens ulvanivorans]
MNLNFLFTVFMPLIMLQGMILEQEVYGSLLSVPKAESCLKQYNLEIDLSKSTAVVYNTLEIKLTEGQEYIEIHIPHIAFNNGMKKGAYSNDGWTRYRSNDFEQFSWKINGRELTSQYEFTVHDSLVNLRNKYLKIDSLQNLNSSSRVDRKQLEEFNQFELSEEFDNKVLSGLYPWYILKIKNEFSNTNTATSTFELTYELELGPTVQNKRENYFHFKFNEPEKELKTPIHVDIKLNKLPTRKINSQIPDVLIYDKDKKILSAIIDANITAHSQNLLLFIR